MRAGAPFECIQSMIISFWLMREGISMYIYIYIGLYRKNGKNMETTIVE